MHKGLLCFGFGLVIVALGIFEFYRSENREITNFYDKSLEIEENYHSKIKPLPDCEYDHTVYDSLYKGSYLEMDYFKSSDFRLKSINEKDSRSKYAKQVKMVRNNCNDPSEPNRVL